MRSYFSEVSVSGHKGVLSIVNRLNVTSTEKCLMTPSLDL